MAPLYAGTAYDVFPGGCVQYAFALPRGPHIPLMEDLDASIAFYTRFFRTPPAKAARIASGWSW